MRWSSRGCVGESWNSTHRKNKQICVVPRVECRAARRRDERACCVCVRTDTTSGKYHTFEGTQLQTYVPVVSVRRQNNRLRITTASALVYAASRVLPCVFVKCVVIGVVVTRVLEYHAFEPIQHRVMVDTCHHTFEGKQLQTCLPVVSVRRHVEVAHLKVHPARS